MLMPFARQAPELNGWMGELLCHITRIVARAWRTCGTLMPWTADMEVVDIVGSASVVGIVGSASVISFYIASHKKEASMADEHERIAAVQSLQRRMHMEPRADSRLTMQYSQGVAEADYTSAEAVAHELVVTNHIFKTTDYGRIIEEVMRRVAAWVRCEYKLTWTAAWAITRRYAPTMLKLHCVRASGQDAAYQTFFYQHNISS